MKNNGWKYMLILLLAASLLNVKARAQPPTGKAASEWFNSGVWLNGLKLKPHSSIDQQEFVKQYNANKPVWDKAFAYLKNTDLESLKPGKYFVDGENVIATVSEGPTKLVEKAKWESHRNYEDIHCVIRGKEKIGLAPVTASKVVEPYDQAKDIAFYTTEGNYYLAEPGTLFIISTKDAHSPAIRVDGYDVVKKIVIKVKAAP